MSVDQRKISKILDELVVFLFAVGADDMSVDLKKQPEGFQVWLKSNFDPQLRDRVEKLQRFLKPLERNEGLEEFCWELAGSDGIGHDSELHLIGQMIDRAEITILEDRLELTLFRQNDH